MNGNILLVWDRIGDYHLARIEALRKLCKNCDVYSADRVCGDNLYKWQLDEVKNHFVLSNKTAQEGDFWNRLRSFSKVLTTKNIKYCCISGYGNLEYIAMIVVSRLRGKKILLFCESWYSNRSFSNILKSWFVKFFVDSFLASGIRAKNFVSNVLKFNKNKIATPYSVVDNLHFANNDGYNPNNKILLCMARYSEEKNHARLINAFLKSKLSDSWTLKLYGAGPLKQSLSGLIGNNKNVILCDWADYNHLPQIYAQASFFVLASTFEPWGLVVNEAMAAGLPIAISSDCGCLPDLLCEGENGFSFDAQSIEQMVVVFNKIANLKKDNLDSMSKKSLQIIENYSPDIWANKVLKLFNL